MHLAMGTKIKTKMHTRQWSGDVLGYEGVLIDTGYCSITSKKTFKVLVKGYKFSVYREEFDIIEGLVIKKVAYWK